MVSWNGISALEGIMTGSNWMSPAGRFEKFDLKFVTENGTFDGTVQSKQSFDASELDTVKEIEEYVYGIVLKDRNGTRTNGQKTIGKYVGEGKWI